MADTIDYAATPPPPLFGLPLSAAHGAEVSAALRAARIYAGTGIRISRTPDGCVISATGKAGAGAGGGAGADGPRLATVVSMADSAVGGAFRARLDDGRTVLAYCTNATYQTRILTGLRVVLYPVQAAVVPGTDGEQTGADADPEKTRFFFSLALGRPVPCKSGGETGSNVAAALDRALWSTDGTMLVVPWSGGIGLPEDTAVPDSGTARLLFSRWYALAAGQGGAPFAPQDYALEGFPVWHGAEYGLRRRGGKWILYPAGIPEDNPTGWTDWDTGEVRGDGWWEAADLYEDFSPAGAGADGREPLKLSVSLGENLVHQEDSADGGTLYGTYKGSGKTVVVGVQTYRDSSRPARTWTIEEGALRCGRLVAKPVRVNGVDGFGFDDPRAKALYWSATLPDKSDCTFTAFEPDVSGDLVESSEVPPLVLSFRGFGPGTIRRTRLVWLCDSVTLI